MSPTLVRPLKASLFAGLFALLFLAPQAQAQVDIEVAPPDACVATFAPVYYNGYASYWCGDNWYYRNGGGWGIYRNEPAFLAGHRGGFRGGWAPGRQFYGRGRPGGGARAGGGFHGGGRGGGGHGGGGRR